ncbi:MAG: hypothetical protein ACXV7D_14825 [Thermoanaerobaculia bacterium]
MQANPSNRRLVWQLTAVLLWIAALPVCADDLRFTIESVRVDGLRFASERIVIAESRIVSGRAYSEPELRDALSRIQRLPFVIHADFALRRGSERDRYVLAVTIEEMKPLFLDYGALFESIGGWPRGLFTNSDVYRHNEEYPNLGGRLFLGSRSVLLLSADMHGDDNFVLVPVYGISFTQYDLFGTRASVTASVRYRENSFDLNGFPDIDGRRGLRFGDHLLWDVGAAVPLSGNQALRAEWHHRTDLTLTGPSRNQRLTQIREDAAALLWIYNSTNDLLFPTAGTYGEIRGEAQVRPTFFTVPGTDDDSRVNTHWVVQDFSAQFARYLPITATQSVVLGAGAIHGVGSYSVYRVRGGYSATRPITLRGIGGSAIHFESAIEQLMPAAQTNVMAGVALRTGWGILHFDFRYENIGGHSP